MDLSYGEEYERFRAEVREFLEKNKDSIHEDLTACIRSSTSPRASRL